MALGGKNLVAIWGDGELPHGIIFGIDSNRLSTTSAFPFLIDSKQTLTVGPLFVFAFAPER